MRHESVERREPADPEHDEIALFAGTDANLAKAPGASALGVKRATVEQQRLERAASVRRD
jgi:hypothetical protein